jgi:hypothetical protein
MKLLISLAIMVAGPVTALPLHLDLEMTSEEYRTLLLSQPKTTRPDDPAITEALKMGERLSKWIEKINSSRAPENAIRLTSAQTRRGIPIERPNKYSPSIIQTETISLLADIPAEMKSVLTSSGSLPEEMAMTDEMFITHARRVDRNYQSAARFKSVDQYRSSYIIAADEDVRGFYYLMKNKITETELRDVGAYSSTQLSEIKDALVMVCTNGIHHQKKCKTQLEEATRTNSLAEFYQKYIEGSRRVWNGFFRIPPGAKRTDAKWAGTGLTVPFNTPEIPKFGPYLKDNVEDEFRWTGWGLKINMGRFPKGPYLKFEPGVVPHVNKLGGNQIVMDSNQPIEEYESQWTIRHEFGHVLGLPDCYHEFYDVDAKAYVNYQLDITDLMCSRAGNMNERIYLELKKAYAKGSPLL